MRISTLIYALSIFMMSCGLTSQQWQLSEVYVFGEEHNELIINREQEYGDGTPNGCLVPGMMRLDIKYSDSERIRGTIKSVRHLEGLPKVYLKIVANDKSIIKVLTDIDGAFTLPIREGDQLRIEGLGYETMTIKWDALLAIIEEAE